MPYTEQRRGLDRRAVPRGGRDRRTGMPFIGAEQMALDGVRFLRDEIKAFVAENGENAAAYFERALREWYGPLEHRVRFLKECAAEPRLNQAWRIVHAAGYKAASLLPFVVRHYYGRGSVDHRA